MSMMYNFVSFYKIFDEVKNIGYYGVTQSPILF